MLALLLPAMREDLVKRDRPRPGKKVRAHREFIEVLPHQHLRLLQNVLRRRIAWHESMHIQAQRTVMSREQFEKLGCFVR